MSQRPVHYLLLVFRLIAGFKIWFLPRVEVDPQARVDIRLDPLLLMYLTRVRPGLRRRANYRAEIVNFADNVSKPSYRFEGGVPAREHGGPARFRHISRSRIAVALP